MTDTPNRRKDDARPAVPLQWGEQPDALQALCARYELENQIVQSSARLLGMLGVGAVQLPIKGTDQYVVVGTLSMIAAVLPAVSAAVGEPVATDGKQPGILTRERIVEITRSLFADETWTEDDITLAFAIEREVAARLAAPTQAKPVPTPSAALTPDGRAIKWKAEFAMEFWVNKGYRPLYLAAPTQVSAPQAGQEAQAVPDLHDAIMNLPDNGGAYEGRERTVYKLGHRDARHAAAELAIGYVPATSSTSGAPAAPDEVITTTATGADSPKGDA